MVDLVRVYDIFRENNTISLSVSTVIEKYIFYFAKLMHSFIKSRSVSSIIHINVIY